ncbi:hypothetical protein EXIGLDRAFT_695323 [Exidia glandulosa HHB12029]|uniref:F-box domain-containing protein n=1 Tax=Exidia glandulosa HHB12029 TaxID=1314781 RepID=A0A165FZT5_EXIGL|nr:hypothetical protein EXIGLDRAFT_695323 [Exidia glandulosa HHB12029]
MLLQPVMTLHFIHLPALPLDVVVEIAMWMGEGRHVKKLIRFAGTAKTARAAALPVVLRTLAVSVDHVHHFMALDQIRFELPTRTLLLAIPVVSVSSHYTRPLQRLKKVSSLAIVALPPDLLDDTIYAGNTPETFSAILGLPLLQANLGRLSLACNLAEPLDIGQLHLDRLGRLTELRLGLHSKTLTVSSTFSLPDTIRVLCLSPDVVVVFAALELRLPALTSLAVMHHDRTTVSWPGDHVWKFPPPTQPSVVALGSAFRHFVGGHNTVTDVLVEDVEVNEDMLEALILLPHLTRLSVHPLTTARSAFTEAHAIQFLACKVLGRLESLKVLHLGTRVTSQPHPTYEWEQVVAAIPPSLQLLQEPQFSSCPPYAFDWANDELKDLTFRNPDERSDTSEDEDEN